MKALTLISASMIDIGVLQAGEVPTASEAQDCLLRLNQWIDGLANQRLSIYYVPRVTKTLTASTASYTVGTGGNIDIARPLFLDRAAVIYDNTATIPTETLVRMYSDQEWQMVSQKTLTAAYPTGVYYDYSFSAGLSTIWVWPIPTSTTTTLVLYTPQQALTQFADLTTDYTFPPGYERVLRSNLACEISPMFQTPVTPDLRKQAVDSLADVKRANTRPTQLVLDSALTSRHDGLYNIYSDTVGR